MGVYLLDAATRGLLHFKLQSAVPRALREVVSPFPVLCQDCPGWGSRLFADGVRPRPQSDS